MIFMIGNLYDNYDWEFIRFSETYYYWKFSRISEWFGYLKLDDSKEVARLKN
jgi:hypothetical protein